MIETFALLVATGIGTGLGWRLGSTNRSAWTEQRGVLFAMAGVAATFWVVIALGFRLHQQTAPMGMDAGLVPAVIVLALTVTVGVRRAWGSWGTELRSLSPAISFSGRSNAMADRKVWLATMAADPLRSRYAAQIAAGDSFWTPTRIEYDLDTQATTCCPHLAPIESAMRGTGLRVRLNAIGSARAECCVDSAALAQRFALPDCVKYQELQGYDRSLEDPPQAALDCTTCGSRLWVRHPQEADSSTPTFPARAT